MTQDDAGSAPMLGSQPVAWGFAVATKNGQWEEVFYSEEAAKDAAYRLNGKEESGLWFVVPLYRQPTLTDEEREAMKWAEDAANTRRAAAIRGLLRRLT